MIFLWSRRHPVNRGFYAVLYGSFKGSFFVVIKRLKDSVTILTLPEKEIHTVPILDFKAAAKDGILIFIKKLPRKVYKVVEQEFFLINNKDGLCGTKKNNKPNKRSSSRA
jgi:hypothetical protein